MRIKVFTLMLMAVLFSSVGFAQKSIPVEKRFAFNREAKFQLMKQNSFKSALAVNPQNNTGRRAAAKSPAKAPQVVTPPADGEVEYFTLEGTNSKGGNVTRTVEVIWDGDDDVYISGLSYYLPNAYVKGTFKGDDVIFEMGQYMGSLDGQDIYFGAMNKDDFTDAVATFDEDENAFIFSESVVDNADARRLDVLAYWEKGLIIAPGGEVGDKPVEIPSDLEIETYAYTAYDYFDEVDVSGNLNIGFYGNDVYIQGMSVDVPSAWIKGTFANDTTVLFPSGQMLEEDLYFISYDGDVAENYTLIYEPETGNFYEGPEAPMINTYKDRIYYSVYQFYYNYEIKKITEQAATPAKSVISPMEFLPKADVFKFALAKVDTDGEGLVAEKLSYKLYYTDEAGEVYNVTFTKADYPSLPEDLTEIPATFTDNNYFKDGALTLRMNGHTSWKMIGLSAVYYGGGESHESEIAWYTPTWPVTVTLPDGATVTEHTFKGETYNSDTGSGVPFEKIVGVAFVGNDMYIRGVGDANDDTWIKGTKNADGAYVFANGQDLGNYSSYYRLFFVGFDDDSNVSDVTLTVDAANGVYVLTEFRENASYTDRSYYLTRFLSGCTIDIAEAEVEVPTLVEVPEGLVTETWSFSATDHFDNVTVSRSVNVGFDGDDVYVQGISEVCPNAWVKGVVEDGQITFPFGQYLGTYNGYDIWFLGWNSSTVTVSDYVMEYDAEGGVMTNSSSVENLGINIYKNRISGSLYESYQVVTIKKVIEKAATPATPSITTMGFTYSGDKVEFNVPALDVDGDGLVTSKLSYKLYYDEGDGEAKEMTFTTDLYECLSEDMTVIPYGFVDVTEEHPNGWDFYTGAVYLNMDHSSWTRVGIQSIYTGGDETNVSEIGWYTITWPQTIELPEGAEVSTYVFSGTDSDGEFSRAVNVAMVGDDVYIQGVGTEDAESWIKGTKNDDGTSYTFAKGQTLGYFQTSTGRIYLLYLMGYSETFGALDVKMTYDAETNTFTTVTEMVENADYVDNLYSLNRITAGAVIQPIPDVAATPATPSADHIRYTVYGDVLQFTIPVADVNDVPILPGKLSYKLYYDEGDGVAKEVTFTTDLYERIETDMAEVAYGFSDQFDFYADHVYLNMEHETWTRVGIQTIYAGGGETNASEIGWYDIIAPWSPELPEDVEVAKYEFTGTRTDGTNSYSFATGINLAMVEDDVYVQGLCFANTNLWLKGTKGEDNVYTFSFGQYMGLLVEEDEDATYYNYLFLLGFDNTIGVTEFQMSYDEETGKFTSLNFMVENADYVDKMYYNSYVLVGAKLIPVSDPDAISTIAADGEEGSVRYNIAGQRVGKNYKGIVVENGKKVLVK